MSESTKSRKAIRKFLQVPVRIVRVIRGGRVVFEGTGLTGESRDFSARGISIVADFPFHVDDLLKIRFRLPDEKSSILLSVRIVRLRKDPKGEGFILGLRYVDLTLAQEAYLNNYMSGFLNY